MKHLFCRITGGDGLTVYYLTGSMLIVVSSTVNTADDLPGAAQAPPPHPRRASDCPPDLLMLSELLFLQLVTTCQRCG